MLVNSALKGFLNKPLVAGSCFAIMMVAVLFIVSSFTRRSERDLYAKQTNLVIREIGHRLLLQTGDRTSRVLPVTEVREGTFQLTFEHSFAFNHDSLIALSQGLLPKTQFPYGYTLTVHDCKGAEIIYGFQINGTTPDILACTGRIQPRGCYIIEFTFPNLYETTFKFPFIGLVGSGLLLLSTFALLIGGFGKGFAPIPVAKQFNTMVRGAAPELTALGTFLFDVKNQRLLLGSGVISLTNKECKLLELLSINFGELTPRETLMQVWANEGVITGRSLDMFVSKLRKKLSGDPELSITNVHGKGYKLEIPIRH